MTQSPQTNSKGFTLIELLVVISIISLLSSVVLASLSNARTQARNTATAQQAQQLATAIVLSNPGSYPVSTGFTCLTTSCNFEGNIISDPAFRAAHLSGAIGNALDIDETPFINSPGGPYQGIFYTTTNDGRNAFIMYTSRDQEDCPRGRDFLTGSGSPSALCAFEIAGNEGVSSN